MTARRMASRLASLATLAGIGLLAASPGARPPSSIAPPHVPGEILVGFAPGARDADRAAVRSALGARRIRSFARAVEQLSLGRGLDPARAIERLRRNPAVRFAEPNWLWHVDALPNDRLFDELYGLRNTGQTGGKPGADIGVETAWDLVTGSREVVVGVIDTGIDYTHPDLAANIWTNPGEIPGNGTDDDGNGYVDDVRGWDFANDDNDPADDVGHGTHVAGTIGAVADNGIGIAGVAWKVRLVPLKFIASNGFGTTADAIAAVEYATAIGADVTNNSWGGGAASAALLEAIRASAEADVLFVAAAGNDGSNTDTLPHYPSSYDVPTILAVTAVDHNDARPLFANLGPRTVDLAAPGVNVLSTVPGGAYAFSSGTSMAAPHAAGAAALVRAMAPQIGALELKQLLMDHVDRLPNLIPVTVAGGRLNVAASLAERDRIAPGPVGDVTAERPTSNTVALRWTATGDDGDAGTASVYEVRYAPWPIDEASFPRATRTWDTPRPAGAGAPEQLEVSGLAAGTRYWFALRALDEWGNRGPVSAADDETTLPAPTFASSPEAFALALHAGDTATRSLEIANAGDGTLDWSVVPDPGAPWLAVSPSSGRLGAGETAELSLAIDTRGEEPGELVGSVDLATNDPLRPLAVHPVTVELTSAPAIAVSPAALDFGEVFVGGALTLALELENFGTEPLVVGRVGTEAAGIEVAPEAVVVESGGRRTIEVTFAPQAPGALASELHVVSDAPSAPLVVVPLVGTAATPPGIEVGPPALEAAVLARTTETVVLTIGNPGPSPLVVDLRFAPGVRPGPPIAYPLVNGGFETGDLTGWQATNNGVFGRLDWKVVEAGAGLLENSAPFEGVRDALNGFEGAAGLRYDLQQDLAIPAGATRAELSFYDRIQWDDLGLPAQLPRSYEARIEDPAGGAVLAVIAQEEILFDGTGRHDLGWQRRSIDLLPWAGRTVRLRTRQLVRETLTGPAQMELDAFAIDLEGFPAWLLPEARRVVVAPGSSVDLDVRLDPGELLEGELDAYIRLETNVPDRPVLLVPVRMVVSGVPRIALTGQRLEVASTRTFTTSGATTAHVLPLPRAPGGAGVFELVTRADVSDLGEAATLFVEGVPLGLIGNTGSDCVVTTRSFEVDPARMGAFGADGVVEATVVNSSTVNPVCNPNQHTVRLAYEARADLLDFGTVYRGSTTRLALTVDNRGTAPLEIASISDDLPEFAPSVSSSVIPVDGSLDLEIAFSPQQAGAVTGALVIASNDPDAPQTTVRLEGRAVEPPRIVVDPAAAELELPLGGRGTTTLRLTNPGGAAVGFGAAIDPAASFATVLPDQGSLAAGAAADLALTFDAAGLDPGSYEAELRLAAADPAVLAVDVPLRLVVVSAPDIAVAGRARTADSGRDFTGAGARTLHALAVDEPTEGAATLRITIIGDFGAPGETALVWAEDVFVGATGATGHDCVPHTTELAIGAPDLARLAADGLVEIEVQNAASVGELCPANLHAVRLSWSERADPLEFAATFVGFDRTRRVLVENRGTLALGVSSIRTTTADFAVSAEPFVLEPGEKRGLDVRFAPRAAGAAAAALEIGSDDPDEPMLSLPLRGSGADPPVLELDPSPLELTLGAGTTATRALSISNAGAGPLHVTAGFAPPAPAYAALDPASLALPAGAGVDVTLTVDATHLLAGTFESAIAIGSDDPRRPTVAIPLRVIVTGLPALSVSAGAIEFGETPVGGARERAIELANRGTAPLALEASGAEAGEFEAAALPSTIGPGESAWLRVVFRPGVEGTRSSTISLTTDDPLRPVVPIALSGIGVPPATLVVEPSRIDAQLPSGGSGAARMTIRNAGTSALDFRLLGTPENVSPEPRPPVFEAGPSAPGPIACLAADPARRQLLALLDGSARFVRLDAVSGLWTELAGSPLEARGTCAAAVSAGRVYVAYPDRARLGVYDLDADSWWTIPSPLGDTTAVAAGEDGSLYLVRDKIGRRLDPRDGSVHQIAPPPFDFGARGVLVAHRGSLYGHRSGGPLWLLAYDPLADRWIERAPLPQAASPRAAIDPVGGDYYAPAASGAALLRHRLADNTWHAEPLALLEQAGAGLAWLPDPASAIFVAHGTELARRATPRAFFAPTPFFGRLEPQQSLEIDVSLDAGRLYAGTHRGIVEVSSNDPRAPNLAVPLELRVTGAPRISVDPAAVDFGEVFVGAAREIVLSVGNHGNAALEVGSIASTSEEISVDPPQLEVPPESSREIRVRYAPLAPGSLEASLALASDDPAAPEVTIALAGTAVPRPSLALDPERLETTLSAGARLARGLRVANAGLGALEFSIRVEPEGATFLSVEPSAGRILPGEAVELTVSFDARSTGLGVHAAELHVVSNDPFRESVVIPAALTVAGVPDIAVGRAPVVLESTQTFRTSSTLHALRVDVPPSGSGTLELAAVGDYGNPGETVTLAGEGVTFGEAGPGPGDCGTLEASFPVPPGTLAALAADGVAEIEARNSEAVRAFCPTNRHTLRLRYVGSADRLDYGIVFLGASREIALVVENVGTAALEIGIASDAPEFVPGVESLVIAPGATASLPVVFEPSGSVAFSGTLALESNDPDRPLVSLALAGAGASAPGLELAPRALDLALPEGGAAVEALALSNAGAGPLTFTIAVEPHDATFVLPAIAAGSVAPGETLQLPIGIQAAQLAVGSHTATIEILTNDPLEPRVSVPIELDVLGAPNLVHVGESVTVTSEVPFTTQGALTRHALPVSIPAFGEGRIEVVADGDFGQSIEFAFVSAEGVVIGSVGGVGFDCIPAFGSFGLDADALASLVDDGVVEVEVQNNVNVDPGCAINAHTVRLAYRARADRVDFDTVFVGRSHRRRLTLINEGHEPLEVRSIAAEPAEFVALESGFVLAPGAQTSVSIDFSPLAPGPYSGTLTVTSNDPDTPQLSIPLGALGAEPPQLTASESGIERTLLEGERLAAPLVLTNSGASPLDFSLELREPADSEAAFTLFGTDGGGGGLYTIDRETARATFIGSMGIGAPALAVDPTTGVMYVGRGGGTAALYTVDPRTAVIRLVGDTRLGEAAIAALEFDGAGTLWASVNIVDGPGTGGDHLARIDAATGEATVLGPFGNGIGTAGGPPGLAGIAFDPATGVLYGASAAHAATVGPPALYRIDLATGEASFLARIANAAGQSVPGGVGSLQFLPDGTLVAGTGRSTGGDLIRLDPATGRYEPVGQAIPGPLGALALRRNPADLSFVDVAPPSGTVPPFGALPVEVTFDARALPPGSYRARLALATNDPAHAQVEIPLGLDVVGVPDIVIAGDGVALESSVDFSGDGAATTHAFALERASAGGASLELAVEGDFGAASEVAELRIGDLLLGSVGNTGADCVGDGATFVLAARDFAQVSAGGSFVVDVANTQPVGAICTDNRHTVRLRYHAPRERLDFGAVFVGHPRTLPLRIENHGRAELTIATIDVGHAEVDVDATWPIAIQPFGAVEIPVTFAPQAAGPLAASLVIRSSDPDEGEVSLAVEGEALGVPVAEATPGSIRAALAPRGARPTRRVVRLANRGSSDLAFGAELLELVPPSAPWEPLGKGDESANGAGAGFSADRRGGPDSFGYRFADSDGLDGPRFEWVQLANGLTPLALAGDDENSGPLAIGFGFPFYGETFDWVNVSSNGWLSFSSDLTSYSNAPSLPNGGATVPENLLAPFWDDLDLRGAAAIRYGGDAERFVVEYSDVNRFGSAAQLTFQVVLHASGRIVFQYLSMEGTLDSATVGIQNGARTSGLVAAYNEDYVHDRLAVEFAPIAPWAAVAPASGIVAPGAFAELVVELRSADLDEGEREAALLVRSNDPARPELTVPVRLLTATVPLESFEIRPATLQATSRAGTLTAVLELPAAFDPRDVVLATVRIENALAPLADPPVYADEDGDGIEELRLQFDRRELVRLLGDRETATVEISGEIDGRSWFAGTTEVRMIPAARRGRPRR